jgi:hypothetical protein
VPSRTWLMRWRRRVTRRAEIARVKARLIITRGREAQNWPVPTTSISNEPAVRESTPTSGALRQS